MSLMDFDEVAPNVACVIGSNVSTPHHYSYDEAFNRDTINKYVSLFDLFFIRKTNNYDGINTVLACVYLKFPQNVCKDTEVEKCRFNSHSIAPHASNWTNTLNVKRHDFTRNNERSICAGCCRNNTCGHNQHADENLTTETLHLRLCKHGICVTFFLWRAPLPFTRNGAAPNIFIWVHMIPYDEWHAEYDTYASIRQ